MSAPHTTIRSGTSEVYTRNHYPKTTFHATMTLDLYTLDILNRVFCLPSVLARNCLFSKIGVIFFLKGVICKTRELFFSAKNVPVCAQISRTMPPSKHLRNMRGPYLSTEPLNNKCSSSINCALPPLCATIYYVHIMEHIQHNIRYTYSRNYRAYIPAGHNQ